MRFYVSGARKDLWRKSLSVCLYAPIVIENITPEGSACNPVCLNPASRCINTVRGCRLLLFSDYALRLQDSVRDGYSANNADSNAAIRLAQNCNDKSRGDVL